MTTAASPQRISLNAFAPNSANSRNYAEQLIATLERYPHEIYGEIVDALDVAWRTDGTIYTCGNGGSAATASHMVADFANLCGWPIVCLSDNVARLTASANDREYDNIFVEAVRPMLNKQDVVIAFSGFGNSRNVLNLIKYARTLCQTIALTGKGGGKLGPLAGISLVVPSDDMQLIEDVHLSTVHMLTQHFRTLT